MFLNKEISENLFRAWCEHQSRDSERQNRVIPSIEEFEILTDRMFRASLLQEEGDPILSSVAWVSKEDFNKFEIPKYRASELTLVFDTPMEFEAKTIAKMNGIANGRTSVLLAHGTNRSPYIWGVCYFSPKSETIGYIPAGDNLTRHIVPDIPTVSISGIGSLQISRGEFMVGRIENGSFLPAHVEPLALLGDFLYRLIGIEVDKKLHRFQSQEDAQVARTYLSCIEYIIEVLSQIKIGSTIIVVKDSDDVRKNFDSSWGVSGSLEVDKLQERMIWYSGAKGPNSSAELFKLDVERALRNRLRNIVDLAKMDGALLLSPSFEVIGFGAKLKALKWKGIIEHGPLPYSEKQELLDFSRLGTRHNSALNFVGEVEGAVALVSSSDGPIRGITKNEQGRVVYWPDCRISMFR